MEKSTVYVIKTTDLFEIAGKAKDLLTKLSGTSGPIETVLLKPNVVGAYEPKAGVTTSPDLIAALCTVLSQNSFAVRVGDCPGESSGTAEDIFVKTGIKEASGPMFVNLGQEATLIDFPRRRSGKVAIANRFIDSDIVISVAKLKTSCFMMISGAVKNFYGSIPGTQKALIHNEFPDRDDFADMLIDLAAVPKKSMALIDGGLIMHGNGPVHGKVREENIYILSDDIFAADFVMAKLLGFKEREVPVLKRAMERGLLHPEGIEIFSDITMPMAAIEIPVTLQSYLNCTTAESDRRVQHIASIRVEIDEDKCECCGHCASVCPTHSIDLDDVFPRINYETCINCFCCNELCPVGAPHPAEDIGRLWKGVMKNEG